MKMRKKGFPLIAVGLLLIAAALFLTAYNYWDSLRAGAASEEAMESLLAAMSSGSAVVTPETSPQKTNETPGQVSEAVSPTQTPATVIDEVLSTQVPDAVIETVPFTQTPATVTQETNPAFVPSQPAQIVVNELPVIIGDAEMTEPGTIMVPAAGETTAEIPNAAAPTVTATEPNAAQQTAPASTTAATEPVVPPAVRPNTTEPVISTGAAETVPGRPTEPTNSQQTQVNRPGAAQPTVNRPGETGTTAPRPTAPETQPTTAPTQATTEPTQPVKEIETVYSGVMPYIIINGYHYIGYVSVPDYKINLPVLENWSYDNLKVAPCRFSGDLEKDDLIIMSHNYASHFGPLKYAPAGTDVYFTDVYGNKIHYEVIKRQTVMPDDVKTMTSGDWDLTLFTCHDGGEARCAIRCKKVKS